VRYANFIKEGLELFIFTSPISLHGNDFSIEESFNKSLKFMKFLKHFRLEFNEINPGKLTKIINKAHVVFIMTIRFRSWPKHQKAQVLKDVLIHWWM
jgi:hypothetical protein